MRALWQSDVGHNDNKYAAGCQITIEAQAGGLRMENAPGGLQTVEKLSGNEAKRCNR